MKAVVSFIAIIIYFFYFPFVNFVFSAAQLSVSNLPLAIDRLQEFEVSVNFSCPGCSDSYLRGVFYPNGSSYFGFTQDNSGNWSNAPGGNCITYFKIGQADLTPEGSWSGRLKFKPDINSSYYSGPGEYLFKIGRYTSSCGSPSVWSSESTIAVNGPTPTPTITPTPTAAPTNTPTTTPVPTNIPTSTPAPDSPTAIPLVSPIQEENMSAGVLGENAVSDPAVSPGDGLIPLGDESLFANQPKKPDTAFQVVLIILGIILIAICVILTVRVIKRGEVIQNEEE